MNLQEVVEQVLCKSDVAITELNLIKVQVVKKKFLDQVESYTVNLVDDNLPDQIGVIGYWTERSDTSRFDFILFTYGNIHREVKLGKVDVHGYAYRLLREEDPGFFEPKADASPDERSKRYDQEREAVAEKVALLRSTLPKLFTT